jgi:hypothetical protein
LGAPRGGREAHVEAAQGGLQGLPDGSGALLGDALLTRKAAHIGRVPVGRIAGP